MNEPLEHPITAVIRSIGERTAELCEALLAPQIPGGTIHVVRVSPFTEALKRTYEIALAEGRTWTLVLDADVIIRPGAVQGLLAYARSAEDTVFEVEGKVLDKFLDSPRKAGNHLYRTALLQKALEYVTESVDSIRPESYVKTMMTRAGYDCRELEDIVGLHDFEQSYRDIYRKCFVQARKHTARVQALHPLWEDLAGVDADYAVALQAFSDGIGYGGAVGIDGRAAFMDAFDRVLEVLEISEKEPIADAADIEVLWSAACTFADIFRRYNAREKEYRRQGRQMKRLEMQLESLKNSKSFRLGSAILAPLKGLRNSMQK